MTIGNNGNFPLFGGEHKKKKCSFFLKKYFSILLWINYKELGKTNQQTKHLDISDIF